MKGIVCDGFYPETYMEPLKDLKKQARDIIRYNYFRKNIQAALWRMD